jgi:hypothetical protein
VTIQPNYLEFDHFRNEVEIKLTNEVQDLKRKIEELRMSESQNKELMIATYEKMVGRKEKFIKSWSMSEVQF